MTLSPRASDCTYGPLWSGAESAFSVEPRLFAVFVIPLSSRSGRTGKARTGSHSSFKDNRQALPDPDTDRSHSDSPATARQLVGDMADDTGAGCPQWMSDGDRATVNVHFRGIQLWPEIQAGEALRGECLVQLDDVDVGPGLARLGQCPVRRFDGGDAEHVRVVARDTARDDSRQGLGPGRRLLRPDDEGSCAVVERGGIASGDSSFRSECRPQRREGFQG